MSNLKQNKSVFKPNLTTFLSFSVARKRIKNMKILDLGCGNGVIGILLFKEKKLIKLMHQIYQKVLLKMHFGNYKK